MYIISVDLGSSNVKAIVLEVKETAKEGKITFIGRVRQEVKDFTLFISELLNKFNIDAKDVETIVATGTGSSYLDDSVDVGCKINIIKVDEFDAIGYGGLILAKKQEGIVVSVGTGTAIIYSDLITSTRIGGTGLGGGTLVGLGNAVLNSDDSSLDSFKNLIDIAKKGDYRNVNLTISDINKGSIGNMTADVTAANFAGVNKEKSMNDKVAGVVNLIIENICLLVHSLLDSITLKKLRNGKVGKLPIIFIGTMLMDEYIHSCIKSVGEYTGDNYLFVSDPDIAIAIGAHEYYLLRCRRP